MISNDVIQLVLGYLFPALQPDCRGAVLLARSRRLLRLASVSCQWRAVALPMFYRAVHVVIGGPPKSTNAFDIGDITICTNIGFIRAAGRTGSAREAHIIMRGLCQPADLLHRQLQLAGLGGEAAWPAVERLRFDMRDFDYVSQTYPGDDPGPESIKVLNDFLSQSFPSLLEI
ncbi:hypothetical protein FBU31_005258, partial [Coemansia sp. 'formosensis']